MKDKPALNEMGLISKVSKINLFLNGKNSLKLKSVTYNTLPFREGIWSYNEDVAFNSKFKFVFPVLFLNPDPACMNSFALSIPI